MFSRRIRRYILNPEYDKCLYPNKRYSYDYIGYECDTYFTVIYSPFDFSINWPDANVDKASFLEYELNILTCSNKWSFK